MGNGIIDDCAALRAFLAECAAEGKAAHFPAGIYLVIPAGGYGAVWPSGVRMFGAGQTSVLKFHDSGVDAQPVGFVAAGVGGLVAEDMLWTGTVTPGPSYPSGYPSLQIVTVESVAGLTLRRVTGDKAEYLLKFQDYPGAASSGVLVEDSGTLAGVLNPFFLARVNGLHVKGGSYAAATVGQQAGRWPHHFYLATAVTNALIESLTCSGGQHCWATSEPAPGEHVEYRDITLTDICQGAWDTDTYGTVTYDGLTLVAPSRSKADEGWFTIGGSGLVTVKDFNIACAAGRGQYLVTCYGGNGLFQNGAVTNSVALGAEPPGSYKEGGTLSYENVSVT